MHVLEKSIEPKKLFFFILEIIYFYKLNDNYFKCIVYKLKYTKY